MPGSRSRIDARCHWSRTDAGLRAVYLAALDRDLRMAEIGALYEVVPMTDWQSARRLWFLSRDGGVRVTNIEVHDRPRFLSPGGPVGGAFGPAGAPVAAARRMMRRA